MKVLIVGCGSVGHRHARNANTLGTDIVLCDLQETQMKKAMEEIGKVPFYSDYLEAIKNENIDAAVIAVPTSLHIKIAKELALHNIHILIEKPLSDSLEGVKELFSIVEKKRITAMMGHSYRFHEGYLALKNLIEEKAVGKIYHVYCYTGWYLPDWHIHENYRDEYDAHKSLGGGVVLTSFSHSFDTFRWFFGDIAVVLGWKNKISPLQIDVEDSAYCLLQTDQGTIIVCVADFLSRFPRNEMLLTGSEGYIEAKFSQNLLYIWRAQDKRFPPGDLRAINKAGLVKILEDGVQYDT